MIRSGDRGRREPRASNRERNGPGDTTGIKEPNAPKV
jgi:hypothetical protein